MDIDYNICFICCYSEGDFYAKHLNGKRFFIDPDKAYSFRNRGFEVFQTELNDFDKNLKICRFCENEIVEREMQDFE